METPVFYQVPFLKKYHFSPFTVSQHYSPNEKDNFDFSSTEVNGNFANEAIRSHHVLQFTDSSDSALAVICRNRLVKFIPASRAGTYTLCGNWCPLVPPVKIQGVAGIPIFTYVGFTSILMNLCG